MFKKWWFRTFLVPLAVAVLTGLILNLFQIYSKIGKRISYSIEGPITYVEASTNSPQEIIVNGIPTKQLYGHKVRLWNSGFEAIENLLIEYRFETNDRSFKILFLIHNTIPPYQFGEIFKKEEGFNSITYRYELINKGDEIFVNFLSNGNCVLNVWLKSKDMEVIGSAQSKENERTKKSLWIYILPTIAFFISALFFAVKKIIKTKFGVKQIIKTTNDILDLQTHKSQIDEQTIVRVARVKEQFEAKIENE